MSINLKLSLILREFPSILRGKKSISNFFFSIKILTCLSYVDKQAKIKRNHRFLAAMCCSSWAGIVRLSYLYFKIICKNVKSHNYFNNIYYTILLYLINYNILSILNTVLKHISFINFKAFLLLNTNPSNGRKNVNYNKSETL